MVPLRCKWLHGPLHRRRMRSLKACGHCWPDGTRARWPSWPRRSDSSSAFSDWTTRPSFARISALHKIVLNCAGPFSATAQPMMEACLAEGVHYLDITGEIDVIEAAAGLDGRAKAAGVILLPAVGFDVVPSDCLAKSLSQKLPDANHLELAFAAGGSLSPGTAKTALEGAGQGGWRRGSTAASTRAFCVENARSSLSGRPANLDDHPVGRRGECVSLDGDSEYRGLHGRSAKANRHAARFGSVDARCFGRA